MVNSIEYRHESVGVWGVIDAQMVCKHNTIQYSLGISIVLSNGMSNFIVHRERLTPVEQIFNQGMYSLNMIHLWELTPGT